MRLIKKLNGFFLFSLILIILTFLFNVSPSVAHQNSSSLSEIQLLKQQIEILIKKVNVLEKKFIKINHKEEEEKSKIEPAPIQVVQSGHSKTKLKLSGFVNRGIAFYDNGRNSEIKSVDVNEYSSRINIGAEAMMNPNFKGGATIEMEVDSNSSSNVDIGQADNKASNVSFTKRILEVFFDHKKWGKLSIGHGKTASDQVGDNDLSGTNVLSEGADFGSFAGGIRFIKGTVSQTVLPSLPTSSQGDSQSPDRDRAVGDVWQDIMGARRLDRIRYDTPAFYGFTLSAGHAVRDVSDFAIRHASEWQKTKVVASLGYANLPYTYASSNSSGTQTIRKGTRNYGGSLSILFNNGLSLGGSWASKTYGDSHRKIGTAWTVKAGYQQKFFDIGTTCLAFAYGQGKALYDGTTVNPNTYYNSTNLFSEDNSEKIKIYGAYLVQNFNQIGTEIFMGFQMHQLNRKPYNQSSILQEKGYHFKQILAAIAGARVKF